VKYSAALPIIMGQNIGTCVTALLSGIGASKNARRASLIHLYFNLIGTILFMAVFYAIHAVFPFAFMADSANAAGIAVIHTAFNLVATAALLPFSALLEKLAMLTIRDDETEERIDDFQLLDERFLAQPAFAVEQCRVVAGRMAQLTQEAILDAIALIGGELFPEDSAPAFSLMIFAAGLGGVLFQPVISLFLSSGNPAAAYWIAGILSAVTAVVLAVMISKEKAAEV